MTKILGICGSPRKGGNSEILLQAMLGGARSAGARTKKLLLSDLHIKPCMECGVCDKTLKCVLRDGLEAVYSRVDDADIIVISSPIFFGSIPAQVKMMVDRLQPLWIKKEKYGIAPLTLKKRKGFFLCVSGSRRKDFFENAKKIIRIFFAVLDIKYAGEIYCGGVNGKGDIRSRKDILKRTRRAGERLIKKP